MTPDQSVAVVTGAGGGLGARVAMLSAIAGQAVACVDIDIDAARRTAQNITAAGFLASAYGTDVTSARAVETLRTSVVNDLGPVRSLMNIAGVLVRESVVGSSDATWKRVFDINVHGPHLMIQRFADDLRSLPHGRIINCSSISADIGYPFGAYAASKAGLSSMTRSALFDFWGTQVTVNAVCPGAMLTPMMDQSAAQMMTDRTPSGRLTTVEDVAAVVGFLNSPAAQAVNGTTLTVDGGATAVFSYTR